MNRATCNEVALLVMSGYPDHGVGADDPGLANGAADATAHQWPRHNRSG